MSISISVAIPTFNRAHLILDTIETITTQTKKVDQVVIVDDGSTDDTSSILNDLSRNNTSVITDTIVNAGPAMARRRAIELCDSEWIALLDSDDLWHEKHIEDFLSCIQRFPSTDVYFSNFITSDSNKDKFSEYPSFFEKNVEQQEDNNILFNKNLYEVMLDFQPIFPSALIFKKSLYEKIGGISTEVGRINSEDAHLIRRLVAYGTVSCTKNVNVEIRKHGENYSSDYLKNLEGRSQILKMLIKNDELPSRYIDMTIKEIEKSSVKLFNMYYWHDEFKKAITEYNSIPKEMLTSKLKLRIMICKLKAILKIDKQAS